MKAPEEFLKENEYDEALYIFIPPEFIQDFHDIMEQYAKYYHEEMSKIEDEDLPNINVPPISSQRYKMIPINQKKK